MHVATYHFPLVSVSRSCQAFKTLLHRDVASIKVDSRLTMQRVVVAFANSISADYNSDVCITPEKGTMQGNTGIETCHLTAFCVLQSSWILKALLFLALSRV